MLWHRRRHRCKCGWLAKLCFIAGIATLVSSSANEVVNVAVGDDGSVDKSFTQQHRDGAATVSTTAGGDSKSPASAPEELQFGRPKAGRRRRARSTRGFEIPRDTGPPSPENEKNLESVDDELGVRNEDISGSDSGGAPKKRNPGKNPKSPAAKSVSETLPQATTLSSDTGILKSKANEKTAAGVGVGVGAGPGASSLSSSPPPPSSSSSSSKQDFRRSKKPRKSKRSHFGFELPPDFTTSGDEDDAANGAGTIDAGAVDVLMANILVAVIAVVVVLVFAVIGLVQARKASSDVHLRSRGVLDVREERAHILASQFTLKASVSSDAVAVMSPLGKWFQLATRDAELKQMQNEVQQDSNFRARADRMEAPSRDMWGNVPKELQMQFDCGPDKNVRGNIAAMVSFVSTYAKQNGADLGRPDQLVRGPEALSAAVVAAREQFLRSRAELEEALSRLTADVARFALNGLLDAAPVLRNFFASSSSAAAKNSINATGTLSTLGKQEIQELRSALHGVLEETLAEHLAAVDPKLAHDFQDAIVNLAVPIIEPSGGAADASWSARRNSSGQFSHGASSSRMLDTQRIIETIRDFVAENGPTEVESSNDTSCRQSVAVWCLAVATLECLNTLHLYFHAFRKRRQHREQGSASHDGQLQLTNDESSDENVVAQHRSISAKVDAVVAKSGGEGKSKEALALISKTVTDITRKIETELSFPKLRAYQDFLGDMAEREAIQKYPGKEDRQREHRQNLQQLFLKQVDINLAKVKMLHKEAIAKQQDDSRRQIHEATLSARAHEHRQSIAVAKKVAALTQEQNRETRRARQAVRTQNQLDRLTEANGRVDDGRRVCFHLVLKAQCLVLFILGAVGLWRTSIVGVTDCSRFQTDNDSTGGSWTWSSWSYLSSYFRPLAALDYWICATWGVLKIVLLLLGAGLWTFLMNKISIFPPSIQGWASLTSFLGIAVLPLQAHIQQVLDRSWMLVPVVVIDAAYFLAFNVFFMTGGRLSLKKPPRRLQSESSKFAGGEEDEDAESEDDFDEFDDDDASVLVVGHERVGGTFLRCWVIPAACLGLTQLVAQVALAPVLDPQKL